MEQTQYSQLTAEQIEQQQKVRQLRIDIKELAERQSLLKAIRQPSRFLVAHAKIHTLGLDSVAQTQQQVELNRYRLRHMYVILHYVRPLNNQTGNAHALVHEVLMSPDGKTADYQYRASTFKQLIEKYGTRTVHFNP